MYLNVTINKKILFFSFSILFYINIILITVMKGRMCHNPATNYATCLARLIKDYIFIYTNSTQPIRLDCTT